MTEKRPKLQILAVIPLLLVLLANLLPLLLCLAVSLKNYNMFAGLFASPWAGGANDMQLFATGEFFAAASSTLLQSLPALAVGTLLAAISAAALPALSSCTGRAAALSAALLFSFVPAQQSLRLLGAAGADRSPAAYGVWMILLNCLPAVGIAVFLGGACSCLAGRRSSPLLRQGGTLLYLLGGLARMFSTNLDPYHLTAGPANAGATLAQVEYRYGLMMMDISGAAAVRVLVSFAQLLPCALAVVLILALLRRGDDAAGPAALGGPSPGMWTLLLAGAALFVVAILCCLLRADMRASLLRPTLVTVGITVLGGCFFLALAVPGAAASASFRLPVIPALLVCASGLSGGMVIEFSIGRTLGMVNTVLPPAFWAAMGLLPLAAYIAYFFYLDARRAMRYSFPVLGLALQAILTNLVQPMLYLSNPSKFPLSVYVRYAENTAPGTGAAAAPLLVMTILAIALWAGGCAPLFVRLQERDTP